jgi:hypothetical protein
MSKKESIGQYLADNAEIISDTFHQSGESPKSTWAELQTVLPKLSKMCGSETFRKNLPVLIAMHDKYRQLQAENESLKAKVSKLRNNGKAHNINGWTVRQNMKGYYSLHKSFKGKVQTIYIGKELDEDKAVEKIAEKMTKLREKGVIE